MQQRDPVPEFPVRDHRDNQKRRRLLVNELPRSSPAWNPEEYRLAVGMDAGELSRLKLGSLADLGGCPSMNFDHPAHVSWRALGGDRGLSGCAWPDVLSWRGSPALGRLSGE